MKSMNVAGWLLLSLMILLQSSSFAKAAGPEATTTSLTVSPSTQTFGSSVTATAQVTSGSATGTVNFFDGATLVGTSSLILGEATLQVSALSTGTHSIVATYNGQALVYQPSSSSAATVVINPVSTRPGLSASSTSPTFGKSVTLTVNMSPSEATGTITFMDGATMLGSATLAAGAASFSTSSITVGSHDTTAVYGGDANHAASTSSIVSIAVGRGTTSASVTTSSSSPAYGASVTFTAIIAPDLASGTVTFKDGATVLGTGTLSGGVATFTTSSLPVGSSSISVIYEGNPTYARSASSAIPVTISQATTTTSLGASSGSLPLGSSLTLTATVAPSTVTGTVTFKNGASVLGTGTVSSGVATLTTSSLPVGVASITAIYNGDANYVTSTSLPTAVTITQGSTTAVLSPSSLSPTYGTSVTFTGTVAPASATGTVTFKDGATTLGTGTLSGGVATFSTSALAVGAHTITAVYSGDADYVTSTSTVATLVVAQASTTVTATASSLTPAIGASVTFTATLAPTSATGTVTFKDGATVIGTGTLGGGVATFSTSALLVGPHVITAVYGGDVNQIAATSAAINVTVDQLATTLTLAASATNPTPGALVTFTATIAPSAATGTVTFKAGSTVLGTGVLAGGVATFSTSTLAVGSYAITAAYGGDVTHAASVSTPVSVTLTRPNPANDPNVRAMIAAQVSAAERFATTQIGNVHQRLKMLHEDDVPTISMGTSFGSGQDECRGGQNYLRPDLMILPTCNARAFSPATLQQAPRSRAQDSPVAVWTAGAILWGQESMMGQASSNRFSTSGVTAGLDARLATGLRAGIAVGFGSDKTSLAAGGGQSSSSSTTGTLYASYRLFGGVFLDGLAGYGQASFSGTRKANGGAVSLSGDRKGQLTFGSVALTSEHKWSRIKAAAYGRLDVTHAAFDSYSEQGSADATLSFGSAQETSLATVIGVRGQYDIEMTWGGMSPFMRLEYRHLTGGNLTQTMSYVADPSALYSMTLTQGSRDTFSGSLGVKAQWVQGVSGSMEYMLSGSGAGDVHAHGLKGAVQAQF